jgi:hypothetical protein
MRAVWYVLIVASFLCATSEAGWTDAISCLGHPKRVGSWDYAFRNSCPSPVRYVVKSMNEGRKYEYFSGYLSPAPSGNTTYSSYHNTPAEIVWACTTGDAGCSDAAANQAMRRLASGGGSAGPRSAAQVECEKYNGKWVNDHCRAWCEDHPHETIPDAGGATCDGS